MSFPSPFDAGEPHPRAREAAEALKNALRCGLVPRALFEGPEGGKMFGVLVARDAAGSEVVLRAFSGLLGKAWVAEGFVPPLFDAAARRAVEEPGEREVKRLTERHETLSLAPELHAAREELHRLVEAHAAATAALKAQHRVAKADRAERRVGAAPELLEALAQESRGEKARLRWLEGEHESELEPVKRRANGLERRLAASARLRAWFSRRLMRSIFDTYSVPTAAGRVQPLRSLYAGEPPSGAGDCAAPKLLAEAFRRGLTPEAMAEFWWGSAPPNTQRVEGEFAPACRLKCGPLLPHMLEGLEVEPPRGLGAATEALPPLRIVYRDAQVLVVEKPEGLLSVSGRTAALVDSVQSRLLAIVPSARLVHRLDLDTSGLLIAALDQASHRALQQQFASRSVEKRYVAWLDGAPVGEGGTIDFPIRVDLEDRPRQIHDPVHGRRAITTWAVLERQPGRTRIELVPRTGRTHQLRVHAAHPLGLGAPIEGDRLYGKRGPRLMLHAQSVTFEHPATGARVTVESPAPF